MCQFSIKRRKGLTEWIDCSVDGNVCAFQRYCVAKKTVINSETFSKCKYLAKKEENVEVKNEK